jgi:hypothetical protein
MHNSGTVQNIAREIIKDKTEEMEKKAAEFALWLQDAEAGGGINGREADRLRQRIIDCLS